MEEKNKNERISTIRESVIEDVKRILVARMYTTFRRKAVYCGAWLSRKCGAELYPIHGVYGVPFGRVESSHALTGRGV
ncbi:MAG: hypothetical protein ACLPX5_05630 [Dissulfurispiraceae bacterium]